MLTAAFASLPAAQAADGAQVVDPPIFAPEAAAGIGLAFDGSILYYTNFGDPFLHRITPAGTPLAQILIAGAGEGVNAMAYDAEEDKIWGAGKDGRSIFLIDKVTGVAALQFVISDLFLAGVCDNATPTMGGPGFCEILIDGLAVDLTVPDEKSIWFSPDASQRIYHFDTFGNPLGFYDVNEPGQSMAPDCVNYSSGVVVAAAGPPAVDGPTTIHYDFAGGCTTWFRYLSSDVNLPVRQDDYPTYDGERAEDGECDDRTFPVDVVWVRDEEDSLLRAFEATPCILGGGALLSSELTVIKHVVNDNGGTATAADFTLTVSGTAVSGGSTSFPGSESGTAITLDPGSYTVTETGPVGYSATFSADCTGSVGTGETKTCTLTNDDQAAATAAGFMTGGGQFDPGLPGPDSLGAKANFGGNASGRPGGTAKGHFNYINHSTGDNVNGDVIAIEFVDPATKTMRFRVAAGVTCTAAVTWRDVAEPGRSADTIQLTFTGIGCPPDQTTASVPVTNGNEQFHKNVRP